MSNISQPSRWRRLAGPWAIPGWLIIGGELFHIVHIFDFVKEHLRWLTTPLGNLFVILFGLTWLFVVLLKSSSTSQAPNPEQDQPRPLEDKTDWKTLYLEANRDRTEFREKYAECANKLQVLQRIQESLPAHSIPVFRLKILDKCVELQGFIARYGPDVLATRREGESPEQFLGRLSNPKLKDARIKFTSDYRLNHEQSVLQLRDEIGARCAITDEALDKAIEFSKRGAGAAEALTTVIERFWILALQVNC